MKLKIRNCVLCEVEMEVPKNSGRKYCSDCRILNNNLKAKAHYAKCIASGKVHKYRKDARDRQRERQKDDATRLLARAKNRARTKGVECSITSSCISVPSVCPVLGTPFVKNTEYAMSIDAIDPNKGYTPDNIQVISMKANAMKNSATQEELVKFANWVLTTVKKEPDVYEVPKETV